MKSGSRQTPGRRRVLALALAAGSLAACSDVAPWRRAPPRLFRLSPKNTFPSDLPVVNWQLVLDRPIAATGLDSTRIGLMRTPTELEYYAKVGWTDEASEMILTLLIESFENSKKIVSVGRDSVLLRSDFVLATELREFQAEYFRSGSPEAHVHINAKLIRMPQRTIVASNSVEHIVPAGVDDIDQIIQAFDEALGKVLKGIVEWTLITGSKVAEVGA